MNGYFIKNPGSDLDHTFEWSAQILDSGETIDADLGWTLHPSDADLTIEATTHTGSTTSVRLAGGLPGEAYLVCSNVQTTNDRNIQRSIVVRVANS